MADRHAADHDADPTPRDSRPLSTLPSGGHRRGRADRRGKGVTTRAMDLTSAIKTVRSLRRPEDVVITTMGSAREWMALGMEPRDLVFVPSAMGHATSMGLGLALARPDV